MDLGGSASKLGGKKGGLTKQINALEAKGAPVPKGMREELKSIESQLAAISAAKKGLPKPPTTKSKKKAPSSSKPDFKARPGFKGFEIEDSSSDSNDDGDLFATSIPNNEQGLLSDMYGESVEQTIKHEEGAHDRVEDEGILGGTSSVSTNTTLQPTKPATEQKATPATGVNTTEATPTERALGKKREGSPSAEKGKVMKKSKAQTVMELTTYPPNFEVGQEVEAYIPRSLIGEATNHQAPRETLVIIQGDNHQAFQFTTQYDPHQDAKLFWQVLAAQVRKLEPILSEHNFGSIEPEDIEMLRLGAQVIPGLLGRDGRLNYAQPEQRITKTDYKPYLLMVRENLQRLITNEKADKAATKGKDPFNYRGVARELQAGLRKDHLMPTTEHIQALGAQTAFYTAAMETIRREQAVYGVTISNLAHQLKHERVQLSSIASYVRTFIEKHLPSTTDPTDPNPLNVKCPTLPRIFLQAVEGHECRCYTCNPEFQQALQDQAAENAARDYRANLEDKEETRMRTEFSRKA